MQRGGNRYSARAANNHYRGRGRGGARGGGQGSIQPLRGLFASNIWHCDCTPRLPAEHFKVKKEGRNQGRWFYTCQNRNKGGDKRNQGGCDFFLWDEDARLREEGSVLGNGREGERQVGWDAGRSEGGGEVRGKGLFASGQKSSGQAGVREDSDTDVSPSPTPTPVANSRRKRNARDASLDNDEEEEDFGLQPDEEQELANLDTSSFETPQKAQKTGVYATPATTVRKSSRKLPWVDEVVQPVSSTSTRKTLPDFFTTPSKPPSKAVTFEEPPTSSDATTTSVIATPKDSGTTPGTLPTSPSPSSRYKDALVDPADSSSSLTNEVISELSHLDIPREKIEKLRSILSKHDLKTQGVTKGRDISRLALKAKGAKIAELEAKIASLEAEREVDRGVIRGLRWRVETGQGVEEEDDEGLL